MIQLIMLQVLIVTLYFKLYSQLYQNTSIIIVDYLKDKIMVQEQLKLDMLFNLMEKFFNNHINKKDFIYETNEIFFKIA